jgi:DNA uptake protein ComE-like DNA-binding protein
MNVRNLAIPAAVLFALSAGAAAPQKKAAPAPKPPAAAAKKADTRLDINSAFQVQLEKLPGITRPLAKKIVANRPYRAVDDLKRIGVPPDTIERIRPLVVVEESMGAVHPPMPKIGPAKPKPGKS